MKERKKMKYAIITEIKNGDSFVDLFDTEQKAIARADYEWHIMSEYDKKRRAFCAVMAGEIDEDGCFDIENARIVKEYKVAENEEDAIELAESNYSDYIPEEEDE